MLFELVINGKIYGVVDQYSQNRDRKVWVFQLIGGAVVTVPFDAIKFWSMTVLGHDIVLYPDRVPVFEYAQ
jgi:hypothetical protein